MKLILSSMIKRYFKISLVAFAVVMLSLMIYRQALLSQIPDAEKAIPIKMSKDEIPIPRRPGTRSVRIVGPPLKVLKFQIDFTRNPIPLDWGFLERTDKRADVMVEGYIDKLGNFSIKKLRDRGHPQAGHYIKNVLNSWKFKQYKYGTIRYYFNVPTRMENMKIQIDASGLQKNFQYIGPRDYLKTGVLCFAQGVTAKNILVTN